MTVILIVLGIIVLIGTAVLIAAGLARKSLRGMNPEEWEQ